MIGFVWHVCKSIDNVHFDVAHISIIGDTRTLPFGRRRVANRVWMQHVRVMCTVLLVARGGALAPCHAQLAGTGRTTTQTNVRSVCAQRGRAKEKMSHNNALDTFVPRRRVARCQLLPHFADMLHVVRVIKVQSMQQRVCRERRQIDLVVVRTWSTRQGATATQNTAVRIEQRQKAVTELIDAESLKVLPAALAQMLVHTIVDLDPVHQSMPTLLCPLARRHHLLVVHDAMRLFGGNVAISLDTEHKTKHIQANPSLIQLQRDAIHRTQ